MNRPNRLMLNITSFTNRPINIFIKLVLRNRSLHCFNLLYYVKSNVDCRYLKLSNQEYQELHTTIKHVKI